MRWADVDERCGNCRHHLDDHDEQGCAVGHVLDDTRDPCPCKAAA